MKKSHYLIIGGIVVLLMLGFVIYSVFASPTVPAQVIVHRGTVEVDSGSGFAPVSGVVELSESDKVRTGDGEASVILYESIVIDLDPETEVAIDELSARHPKLSQPSGDTWTKFAKVTGVESLSINTPDSVATVRGTFFGLNARRALLGEGKLDYRASGQSLDLNGQDKGVLQGGIPTRATLTAQDKALLRQHAEAMISRLRRVRELEIRKHGFILTMIQKRYGLSVDDLLRKAAELDQNQADLDQIEQNAPIRLAALGKIHQLTEAIRQQYALLAAVQAAPTAPSGVPAAPAHCPGQQYCCCQNGWPDCDAGLECRQMLVPGKQAFGVCMPKTASPAAPLQLHSSQPAYCGN